MRIKSVRQIKPIQVREGGFIYPMSSSTRIILDKVRHSTKKIHDLVYQQGSQYGMVGDCCDYLNNDELLALEEKGMIVITKYGK